MSAHVAAHAISLLVLFGALWLIRRWVKLAADPGPPPFKPGERVEYEHGTLFTEADQGLHVPDDDEHGRCPCPVHMTRVVRCEWNPWKGEWAVRLVFTLDSASWEATAPASRVHHLGVVERLGELA